MRRPIRPPGATVAIGGPIFPGNLGRAARGLPGRRIGLSERLVALLRRTLTRGVRTCRACGCTDADCSGCVARTGYPCVWVEEDLCSACAWGGMQAGGVHANPTRCTVCDGIGCMACGGTGAVCRLCGEAVDACLCEPAEEGGGP